jgi:hypothetical protein
MNPLPRLVPALPVLLALASAAGAQPTYKLDVKPELKPAVTLRLDGTHLVCTAITDDPGFRAQVHFRKDGQTIATVEARSRTRFDLPRMEPGTYSAVVELFHPAYKGGTAQKGEFKPASNELRYRIEPGMPVRVTQLPTRALQAILGIQFRPGN